MLVKAKGKQLSALKDQWSKIEEQIKKFSAQEPIKPEAGKQTTEQQQKEQAEAIKKLQAEQSKLTLEIGKLKLSIEEMHKQQTTQEQWQNEQERTKGKGGKPRS